MPTPKQAQPRIRIENPWPVIDCGRYPAKRTVGEAIDCIWYLRGKATFTFEVEWTAMVGAAVGPNYALLTVFVGAVCVILVLRSRTFVDRYQSVALMVAVVVLPDILRSWDVLVAPEPDPIDSTMLKITSMCGKWLSMNVLTIDE